MPRTRKTTVAKKRTVTPTEETKIEVGNTLYELYDETTRARLGAPRKMGEVQSKEFYPIGSTINYKGHGLRVHERIVEEKSVKLFVK